MIANQMKQILGLVWILSLGCVRANWLEGTGQLQLLEYLQLTELPSGVTDGLSLGMVEAGAGYMPVEEEAPVVDSTFTVTSGAFAGVTFQNVTDLAGDTNASSALSNHAEVVATNFFAPSSSYVLSLIHI